MKKILSFLLAWFAFVTLMAQYTIDQSAGKLKVIEVGEVTFEGHAGNNIIVEAEGDWGNLPDRAKGLKVISPSGLNDNTGLGLAVATEDGATVLRRVSNSEGDRYHIKVPSGVAIFYEHSNHTGGLVKIINVASEVEVSANYNSVYVENTTGPLAISSVYGSIEATFDNVPNNGPINLYCVYDDVDVTVPASTKASFTLATEYGDMYTDLDLDYDRSDEEMKRISAHKVKGKLNGGGVDFSIKSGYDNIYLRKK